MPTLAQLLQNIVVVEVDSLLVFVFVSFIIIKQFKIKTDDYISYDTPFLGRLL